MRTLTSCATLLFLLSVPARAAELPEKASNVLMPFNYQGVTLLDSRMKMQFDEARDFYLRIPNDDLLRAYRLRAGLPAPGDELIGCYLGHNAFGQWISGLARMYAVTGDVACKEKAEALMRGWAECIAPDGFFFIEKEPGLPPYYYDKMVCGLVDLYLYCGTQEAQGLLSQITDWAIKNLDRARLYARPTGPGGGEWYTLSENLFRAYQATGDITYLDFAKVWEYTEFWDLLAKKEDIFQHPMNGGWYHAYSHVNSMAGLGAAYAVTGEHRYLDTLKNGFDFLWDSQLWVTGGFGPNETLVPRPKLAELLRETNNHFETQCGSWAGFKLSKYLQRFTGDARYGDWIELLVLNGIGASIPMDPDGRVFYYSEYNLGGSAKQNTAPWACCTGTRPQALAEFSDLIYYTDAAGDLYVNLFTPSTVEWDHSGAKIRVEQSTRFPEAASTEFSVQTDAPAQFALKLRAPGWLAAPMQAVVNDEQSTIAVDEHGWAVIRREWHDGDRLSIELPMDLRASPLLKEKEFPAALSYGPVTMMARVPQGNPSKIFDYANPAASLEAVEGAPLNFRAKANPAVLLRPFYQTKKGERYFMYFDPTCALVRVPRTAATFSPGWIDFGAWHATNTIGSSAQYAFSGDTLTIVGQKFDDAGRAEIKVDGKVVAVLDQYGPNRGEPHRWTYDGLGAGAHTLVLTLLPDKSEASKGNFINVSSFEFEE